MHIFEGTDARQQVKLLEDEADMRMIRSELLYFAISDAPSHTNRVNLNRSHSRYSFTNYNFLMRRLLLEFYPAQCS